MGGCRCAHRVMPKICRRLPEFSEAWHIGNPDAVFTMEKPYEVPATGTVAYQYFTIPTNFTEDKWVQAIEVRPGARKVVHHILVFMKEAGDAKPRRDAYTVVVLPAAGAAPTRPAEGGSGGRGGGPGTLLATTAPGTNAMVFEPGAAMRISAGSTLMLQVHYTANGEGIASTDQSSVGMVSSQRMSSSRKKCGRVHLRIPL